MPVSFNIQTRIVPGYRPLAIPGTTANTEPCEAGVLGREGPDTKPASRFPFEDLELEEAENLRESGDWETLLFLELLGSSNWRVFFSRRARAIWCFRSSFFLVWSLPMVFIGAWYCKLGS